CARPPRSWNEQPPAPAAGAVRIRAPPAARRCGLGGTSGERRRHALPRARPEIGTRRDRAPPTTGPRSDARDARKRLLRASADLFLVLTGLADGLAPKERRYVTNTIRPNNLGPPLPRSSSASGAGIQLLGRRS